MKYFFALLIVSMMDVVGIFGYVISALISRRYWVAVALGIGWRIGVGMVLDMNNSIPAILAAAIVTSVVFYIKSVVISRRKVLGGVEFDGAAMGEGRVESKRSLTALDAALNEISTLVISRYRDLAEKQGSSFPPSAKMSDHRLLYIYETVTREFQAVASKRGERLSAKQANYIAWYFMQIDESKGEGFFKDHLDYELDKFLREGLRETYKHELSLVSDTTSDSKDQAHEVEEMNRSDNYWAALDIVQHCIQKLDLEDQYQKVDMYLPQEDVIGRLEKINGSTAYDLALMLVDAAYEASEKMNCDEAINAVTKALEETGAIVSTEMIQSFRDSFERALEVHDNVLTKVSELALLNGSKIIPQNGSVGLNMRNVVPQALRKNL